MRRHLRSVLSLSLRGLNLRSRTLASFTIRIDPLALAELWHRLNP